MAPSQHVSPVLQVTPRATPVHTVVAAAVVAAAVAAAAAVVAATVVAATHVVEATA